MPNDALELMTIDELVAVSGLSRSTIRRRSADANDDFPKPLRLGENAVRWSAAEWRGFVASRPRAVRSTPAE